MSVTLLQDRVEETPARVEEALGVPMPALPSVCATAESFVVTGIGTSEGPARFFNSLMQQRLGVRSRFVPLSQFASLCPQGDKQVLVVFSQGLSPNAHLALGQVHRFAASLLVTSVAPDAQTERALRLRRLEEDGLWVWRLPPRREGKTLLRVIGPMCASVAGLRIADAIAQQRQLACEFAQEQWPMIPQAMKHATSNSGSALPQDRDRIAFVAWGNLVEERTGIPWKWQEGLYTGVPPLWDVMQVVHGPLQSFYNDSMSLICLVHRAEPVERELVSRLGEVLHPQRHKLIPMEATLPPPISLFEHDAMVSRWMVERISALGIDPVQWPGKGADKAIFELEEPPSR